MSEPGITLNDKRAPLSSKFGYAMGGLGCVFGQIIPIFLTFFMTESLAIPIVTASLMIMLVKIIDAVSDIIAGFIIDKTKSPKGKARPWFLRMAIPYALCLALIYFVPAEMGMAGKVALVAILYALCVSIFGTMLNVARYALIPRMSKHPADRGAFSALGDGMVCIVVGLLCAVNMIMVGMIGWKMTYTIFAIVAAIGCLICFALCKELPREVIDGAIEQQRANSSFKGLLKSLFTNKYALCLLIYVLGCATTSGFLQAGGTYFWTYYMGNMAGFSLSMAIMVPIGFVTMFIMPFVMRKTTRMFGFASVVGGIVLIILSMIAAPNTFAPTIVVMLFAHVPVMQLAMMTYGQMSALTVDYGEWKSGIRSDGVTSSVVNIGLKIGAAIGAAASGFILGAAGFQAGGVAQTAEAVMAVKNIYTLIPGILSLIIGVVFLITWRMPKYLPTIKADLAKRHAAEQ